MSSRIFPLRPPTGEREGTHRGVSRKPPGLARGDGEGEVGFGNHSGFPHLTPALSAPKGGEGGFLKSRQSA
jgi:hypothetical protein